MADSNVASASAKSEAAKLKEQKKLEKQARRADIIAAKVESGELPAERPIPQPKEPRPPRQQTSQDAKPHKAPAALPGQVDAKSVQSAASAAATQKQTTAPVGPSGFGHVRHSLDAVPQILAPPFAAYASSLVNGELRGVNNRATGMLKAVQQAVRSFVRPADKATTVLSWVLDPFLVAQLEAVSTVRPFVPALSTVVRAVRACVSRMDPALADDTAVEALCAELQQYMDTRVCSASRLFAHMRVSPSPRPCDASHKSQPSVTATEGLLSLHAGDTVLVHGQGSATKSLLLSAQEELAQQSAASLHVIVVDSLPRLGGKALASDLARAGAQVTYTTHAGLWTVLTTRHITCALLSAASVLSDGSVLGESGAESVALCAHSLGVPVLCVTEAYKLSAGVLLDAMVDVNELRPQAETLWSHHIGQCWSPAAQQAVSAREAAVAAATAEAKAMKKAGGAGETVPPMPWTEDGAVQAAVASSGPSASTMKELKPLRTVSLSYGLTPAACLTAVLCEAGCLPTHALPAMLSEYARLEEAGRQ